MCKLFTGKRFFLSYLVFYFIFLVYIFVRKYGVFSYFKGIKFLAGIKFRGSVHPRNLNISRGFNFAEEPFSNFSLFSGMRHFKTVSKFSRKSGYSHLFMGWFEESKTPDKRHFCFVFHFS